MEKRAVLEAAFRFQENARPLDMVSHLVINMQHYSSADIIYGDYMMQAYDEKLLRQILAYLTPENLRATLVAQGLHYDHKAQWYQTPYAVQKWTSQQLQQFRSQDVHWPLNLPPKNIFICC